METDTSRPGKRKRKPGKPGGSLKFQTLEELQGAVDGYFKSCEGFRYDGKGNLLCDAEGSPVADPYFNPPTVSGLALALGISRVELLKGEDKRPGFREALMLARERVEAYAESRLYDRGSAGGAQFALENNHEGWRKDTKAAPGGINLFLTSPDDAVQLLTGIAGYFRARERDAGEGKALGDYSGGTSCNS